MSKKVKTSTKEKIIGGRPGILRGTHVTTKIIYGYCYGKTYRDAKEKVNRIRATLINGQTIQRNSSECLFAFCDQWLVLNRHKVKESHM